jgi:hypothetical protein
VISVFLRYATPRKNSHPSLRKTMPALSRSLVFVVTLVALHLPGCPDPAGKFDDFVERWTAANPGVDGGDLDAGPCTPPDPAALDGQYVLALSAVIAPETPILFLTQVTGISDPPGVELELQPLSAADRRTPVGQPLTVGPIALSTDGAVHAELPPLIVSGEANPITGGEIEAQVTLDARFCGVSDFYCGSVSGRVTLPVGLDLAGSTFAMERVQGGMLPEQPFLNCNRDRAAALP